MTESSVSWVVDVGDDDFDSQVIERSREVPVVVDFWAEWCGPCRFLGPILEKLAAEWAGGFVLAKLNVDHAPVQAQKYGIQGIPAVKSFINGVPGPEFTGALPEPAVREFLTGLSPSEADQMTESAASLGPDRAEEAEALYRKVLDLDPHHGMARVGLAEHLVRKNELDEAKRLLASVTASGTVGEQAEILRARIHLAEQRPETDATELRSRLQAEPGNAAVLYDIGLWLAIDGRYEEALETLLEAGRADRALASGQVKELMVRIFHIVGVRSELADDYRSKLSSLLY